MAQVTVDTLKIEDIPVISEFPEIFPEDLLGLPLERQVNILIYSRNKNDHEKHLRCILDFLKQEKLYVKFSKCEFWLREVQFLGHVISEQGIQVDPSKIEAIMNWEAPKTPSEIRIFLGLASYYRRFIENFSRIATPLTIPKNAKFDWGANQKESFEILK
ncbi:uncharacterized mitochondrial protein AtMg00860-like [Helianthus annuus]|uniref:uncharacterized mitochondrial protein AtMg00860-like n=1 Tax=Helianthus annuus TaxID=4232 RepID=UPI000B8F2942|nr:uncharacterized mitochondrial protein AtMg00860-like [Helianthus annuus]